ncbi:1-phosphofructokinase family hexose kinase [Aureimonas mangrovi]|uniref:1-phosphofructokinase family hexose kinase n=1 Tax=Aureimonas mangrovi TaxID=2758041 RepID=UPI00163D444F|nr:PfkB family carbohydrate kinase [Aureimonas mangrovi]
MPRSDEPTLQNEHEICVFAPWPLFTITIESLTDKGDEVYFHAGGQGVWVARMIVGLGHRSMLVGPFGGEQHHVIEALARAEGLGLRPVPVKGANGGYINDRRGGERHEIANVAPPTLDRHEIDDLHNATLTEAIRCGTAVITGTPDNEVLPADLYPRLVKDLRANDVIVVADIAGTVLDAVDEGLTLLKVSHEELHEAGLAEGDDIASLSRALHSLRDKAENIVVSRAGAGCLALMDGKLVEAIGPQMAANDPTGAGDSMTAALAVALSQGLDYGGALRLATAAGALNVTRHGRGTGKLRDIEALASSVEIREVKL